MTALPLKRGRRGSDVASAWARSLRLRYGREIDGKWHWIPTGIPAVSAKAVLLDLGQYVDENGACWPSIGTVADDTDQSEDSVMKRFADLEFLGLIARFPRWRDESGLVNTEGRGRQTSSEVRLLFDTTQEMVDEKLSQRVTGKGSATEDLGVADCDHSAEGAQALGIANRDPSASGLGVADCDPGGRSSATPMNLHLNQEPTPKPLPASDESTAEGQVEDPERVRKREALRLFKGNYPIPSNRPDEVERLWLALTFDEEALAIRGASGVRAMRERDRRIAVVDPAKFLSGGRTLWSEYAPHAPEARPARRQVAKTFEPDGTERSEAWRTFYRLVGWTWPEARPHIDGATVVRTPGRLLTEGFPPFGRGVPADGEWRVIEPGEQRWGAWQGRFAEWTGRRIDAAMVRNGAMITLRNLDGVPFQAPERKRGWLVPFDFPPGKSAADPPEKGATFMTGDDEKFFDDKARRGEQV